MLMRSPGLTAHAIGLGILLAVFCCRVAAQLLQAFAHVSWLPPFDAWHSGALPYPTLVAVQVAIIALGGMVILSVATGHLHPRRSRGRVLMIAGAIYFLAMATRLALGLTLLADVAWFAAWLPAVFHLVLAGFVLLWGHAHLAAARSAEKGR